MRRAILGGLSLLALTLAGPEARAQGLMGALTQGARVPQDESLVVTADAMSYDSRGRVASAEGNVEAVYGARVLRADALTYDEGADRVIARGNVVLLNDDGSYAFAEEADLKADLTDGVIRRPSARIAGGGLLTAAEGRRAPGLAAMDKAVYTACELCAETGDPLWSIAADRVTLDEATHDIVYDGPRFQVMGRTIAWAPSFRHPDPTVKRRTGFLTPRLGYSKEIGVIAKAPYYWALAPDRDVTLTPFVASKDGVILEAEYRALTETGGYRLGGSFGHVAEAADGSKWRGHIDADGRFALSEPLAWGFDVNFASDDTYLRRYGFSDEDRLASRLYLERQDDASYAEANALYFQSFRSGEWAGQIPIVLPEIRARKELASDPVWGTLTGSGGALGLARREGRDMLRGSLGLDWENAWIVGPGLRLAPFATARAVGYRVWDGTAAQNGWSGRLDAAAGLDARWPLALETAAGTHVIEPIAQIVAAPAARAQSAPNEDSLDMEFDETTLFSAVSRFPGTDRWEGGTRFNLGARYDFTGTDGSEIEAAYGRVFRFEDDPAFSARSGLRDASSDHVAMARVKAPSLGLDATARARLASEDLSLRRGELSLSAERGPAKGALSWVTLAADPDTGATVRRSELRLSASVKISPTWTIYGEGVSDLENDALIRAKGGARYEDECLKVDLSIQRRYIADRDATDDFSFGLTAELKFPGG